MFLSTDDGAVRTLTLDNPGRRNAIPSDRWGDLADAFTGFEESDARVLIVTGAGDDFCSGVDVGSGAPGGGVAGWYGAMAQVSEAAMAQSSVTKPTIAAVDGVAAGAGMNLALGCDIVVASHRARFTEIFVRRGLALDFGGTWLLPRRVGLARAKDLALTGRVVDAEEAGAIGLASRVVPATELQPTVRSLADELASGAPLAQRFIKQALDRSSSMSFEESLAHEATVQSMLLTSHDAAEGFAAFLQKRPPEFRGS